MENKNMKNIFIVAGLAVFAGVLTLGVNAAFGLDVPSQDPAGAALHSPVFDGVDVQGPIQNSSDKNFGILNIQDQTVINGDLGISGSVSSNKNVTVGFVNNPPSDTNGVLNVINKIINPVLNQSVKIDDNLDVYGGINVKGVIKNPDAQKFIFGAIALSLPAVQVEGDLKIQGTTGNLDVQGAIINTAVINMIDKPVKIADDIEVANNAIITKDLTVGGASNFALNSVFNGMVTLNKNLITNADVYLGKVDGTSTIYSRGGLVMAGGVSYAAGTISGVREIKNVDGKDLWINVGAALIKMQPLTGDIYFAGNIRGDSLDPLKFKDDVEVSGALRMQSNGNNNYQDLSGTWGAIELGPEGGPQLLVDRNSIDAYGGDLTINSFGSTNVNVGTSLDGSNLNVNGVSNLNGGASLPNGQTFTTNGVLAIGANGSLKLPSGNGQIKNTEGNPILQTWWDGTFGDYTALNSGYAWAGTEPVSVVAGATGVYFMKGLNGAPYQTQIGKIDLSGNLNLPGTYAKAVGGTNRAVYVDSNGNIGTLASSKRFKKNIKDIDDTSWLYRLRPVNFAYKNDENQEKQYGLIAEEVEKVNPSLVTYDESGKVYSVLYQNLFGPIIKALQEQKKENAEIKKALCEIKPELEIC